MNSLLQSIFADGGVYLLIFLYLFMLTALEATRSIDGYRRKFALLSCVILTLFLGLRWETGTDWDSYKELFDSIEFDISFLFAVYSFDIGYVLFNALARLISESYSVFLVLDAALGLWLVGVFITRASPYPNLSIYIFYTSYFVTHFMGSNRRMIAIGALLLAILKLQECKTKGFWLWLGTAFSFHRSSLIGLVAAVVPRTIFPPLKVLLLLSVCLGLGISQLPFKGIEFLGVLLGAFIDNPIVEKLVFYSETSAEHIPENVDVVLQTTLAVIKRGIFIAYYFYATRNVTIDRLSSYLYNIYIVGFAGYLLMMGSPIFQVITTYFAVVEIALTARMFAYSPASARFPFLVAMLAYGMLQLVSALNPYRDLYMPYFWVFSGSYR